jgi:hypothetical protein
MNPMVAYLVLACGSGRDNRTTKWSTKSVSKYAGVGIERAKSAIDRLINEQIIGYAPGSARVTPRYELLQFHGTERTVDEGDEMVWLPNTVVMGTPGGKEVPPVHRLRSAGDPWTLRLFVDLYHAQNLRDDGGISKSVYFQEYERERVGEEGPYLVFAFRPGKPHIRFTGPAAPHEKRGPRKDHPIWDSWRRLQNMGLVTIVPYLFENSTSEAEPIHPYGTGAKGHEEFENAIGAAARLAAEAMVPEWQLNNEDLSDLLWCPVPKTLPDVRMVGIARLLYRPHTSRTAAWYSRLGESAEIAVAGYQKMMTTRKVHSRADQEKRHAGIQW